MKFSKLLICAGLLFSLGAVSASAAENTVDMSAVAKNGDGAVVYETELENGDYTVTVTTGGKGESDANIYINGGERVRKYTLTDGAVQKNEQSVVITDGKLSVAVYGDNPEVNSITIADIAPRTEPGEKPTIYIAGDSTAQTYDYKNVYPQTGWGQVFAEYFTDGVTVENRAMGGRSSKSYNNDGRLDKILCEVKPGDYVFIQFGINDGAANKPERYISVEDYKKLIADKYIGETIKRGAIPVLMTPTSAAWWDEENNKFMESRADYADPTRELAKETGVTFIDANRLITDEWNSMDKADVLSGYFICEPLESKAYPTGTQDTTHLKAKGARRIAKIIAEAAAEKVEGLSEFLKEPEKFTDIDGYWGEENIKALAAENIAVGEGDGLFRPNDTVTRAEFLKLAMDVCGIPSHAYRDGECLGVSNDDWYCYYVQSAADKGILPVAMLDGCTGKSEYKKVIAEAKEDSEEAAEYIFRYDGDAKFTDKAISREEMAAIAGSCMEYAKAEKANTAVHDFADQITGEYADCINAAHAYGVVNGDENGFFNPKNSLTRGEAAAVIYRMSEKF